MTEQWLEEMEALPPPGLESRQSVKEQHYQQDEALPPPGLESRQSNGSNRLSPEARLSERAEEVCCALAVTARFESRAEEIFCDESGRAFRVAGGGCAGDVKGGRLRWFAVVDGGLLKGTWTGRQEDWETGRLGDWETGRLGTGSVPRDETPEPFHAADPKVRVCARSEAPEEAG